MKIKQFPSNFLTNEQINYISLIGAERYFVIHNRQEAVKVMKTMYEEGYRWIARDYESDSLMLYNLKPKKYMDISSWGYKDKEVAEMIGTTNGELMKTIRIYIDYLAEGEIPLGDFFISATYIDSNKQELPNFLLTKQGCEIVSNKLTGAKGVQFTAKYVNRFNEMENHLSVVNQLQTQEDIMIATLQNIKSVDAEVKTVQADIVIDDIAI